ncbi:MAG: sugar ABC transporter substrate-binding protein, partial [Propionivibrio sp.]
MPFGLLGVHLPCVGSRRRIDTPMKICKCLKWERSLLAVFIRPSTSRPRRSTVKRITALVCSALIAAAAPAFAAKKDIKIGFTTMDLANVYFVSVTKGVKDRAQELGIDVTVHDSKADAASQVGAIENFIAQKMDAIIITPIDPNAISHMAKKAQEAGIKVINGNQEFKPHDAFIGLVEYDYGLAGGKIAGQWIKDKLGGKAEVAVLGFPEIEALIDRAQGLKDGITKMNPEAKIVAEQSAATPENGMKGAETMLQAHPNIKVIVAINDSGALGAMEAVKAMGKDSKDFCIVGLDATPEED